MSFWLRLAACSSLLLAACEKENSQYCEGHPEDTENCPPDASTACTEDTHCPGQVCDTATGACVQCTPNNAQACTGMTPVCGSNDTCGACTMHSQCTLSNVCLPDGSCGEEGQTAYVSASGAGTVCMKENPCPLLKSAIARNLPYIKIAADGVANDTSTVTFDAKVITILAEPGAKLDRDGDGPILEVRSANADVKIFDLRLTGASGTSGADGIQLTPNGGLPKLTLTRVKIDSNQGAGIFSTGGTLTVTQSTVSSNQGGGISVAGSGAAFNLTNNFIYRNGDQDVGTFGGVSLAITTAASNVLAFNTVVDNRASAGGTRVGGVMCDIAGFDAPNNIVARNAVGGSTSVSNAQTLGGCTYPTSRVQNDVTGLAFTAPDISPFSYKLLAGSTAIDQGTTASSVAVDFDGDARPQGPAKDIGADELKP